MVLIFLAVLSARSRETMACRDDGTKYFTQNVKPWHEKTNQMNVHLAETQISLEASIKSDQSRLCALSGKLRIEAFFI